MTSPNAYNWIIQICIFIATVAGALVIYGEVVEARTEDKHVQFSNPEIKSQTEYHVKNTDPVAVVKQSYKDSVAEAKFRKTQDSMDLARDQLTKANAVEVYKVSKRVEDIDSLLREYIKIHDN